MIDFEVFDNSLIAVVVEVEVKRIADATLKRKAAQLVAEKKRRSHQADLARARALKRQKEEQEEEEILEAWNAQERIQERADERERQKEANAQLQAFFVKAEENDRAKFMETYTFLYDLHEMASKNNTTKQLTKIVEPYGFPFSKFIYSEEEKEALPLILLDRGAMNMALSLGFWPYRKNPLNQLVEAMKEMNEPQEASAPVDDAILLEIIKRDPFFFLRARRCKIIY